MVEPWIWKIFTPLLAITPIIHTCSKLDHTSQTVRVLVSEIKLHFVSVQPLKKSSSGIQSCEIASPVSFRKNVIQKNYPNLQVLLILNLFVACLWSVHSTLAVIHHPCKTVK